MLLVKADPESLELRDAPYYTALHHAAECRNDSALRALLSLGADIEARAAGNQVRSALHFAALNGAPSCVEALIGAGADVRALNAVRHSPCHSAASSAETAAPARKKALC